MPVAAYTILSRTVIFCLLLLLTGFVGKAQSGSVSGMLAGTKGNPLSYATVTLLRPDSSVVNGDLSADDGSFHISGVNTGNYLLRAESIGYISKFSTVAVKPDKPNVNIGVLQLQQTENALKTVEITGEKRLMELKVDKKVFNVEKNTTTAGGSAADVLQNVPAVSVDVDGNVSLRGKSNVNILIDGKPATLLGSDVSSALQSLPAGSIESVEVITNPSSRYDAQGTTGIINIVTKKDGRFGINGHVTLGAGTRDKYNGSFGLNVKRDKWSVFVNSNFRIKHTFNNVTTHRQDINDTGAEGRSYYTYEHVPRLFNGAFNTLGATYNFNDHNALTVTQNVNFMQWGYRDFSDYYIYADPAEKGNILLHRYRYTDVLGGPVSLSSALDYKKKFSKKGEELNIDATYAVMNVTRKQDYITAIDSAGAAEPRVISSSPGSGGNSSVNVWADYTNPMLTENGKFGAGFKSQFYNFYSSNNPTRQIDAPGETPTFDSTLYSTYNYSQQIHAAYVNWNDQRGKFSYQVGLRGEYALYDGSGSVPRPATFHNSFLNLFPSTFVSYQLDDKQSVYVNYTRRVNRPGFFQMMPYKDYSNPGTVSMGNPNIIPEFIHNVEFSYSRNGDNGSTLITSAYISHTNNLIERVLRPITDADAALGLANQAGTALLSLPVNIASGTTYGLEGTGRWQITKAWEASVSANFFNNKLTIGNIDSSYTALLSNTSGYSWFTKINTNVKLPGGFALQFTGNYESPKVVTQGKQRESYWLDIALKRSFLKNKASLTVNCSDVFKTRRFITDFTTSSYHQTINRVKETRIGNLTFTYNFGREENSHGGYRNSRKGSQKMQPVQEERENNLKHGDDSDQGR